ncbi:MULTISPECIES: hypothetical protein [unclassified Nitrobacter]|uniref:hypothetical protein n=1 Tax=unclassified Nitrobacter TaxID=2620411 RepID=UPI001AC2D429|nr:MULTISPECIES: hypothetical protein [unclassified Nitrobacter]MBN9149153.1 hypothetical protein [Nitrobacter sp.]
MFDITSLPAEAQAIITRHQIQDAERLVRSRSRLKESQELRQDRMHVVRLRDRLLANAVFKRKGSHKQKLNNSAPERDADKEFRRMVDGCNAEIDRFDSQIAKMEAEVPPACLTASRILSELDRLASSILEECARPKVILIDGERDIADALPRFRENVRLAKAAKRSAENEPLHAIDVKEVARRQINRLAARGVPMVQQMFAGGGIDWPKIQNPAKVGANYNLQIDAAALLAFMFKKELIEKLDGLIDSYADVAGTLSIGQRAKRIAALAADIDEAERIEAAAVEAVIADGGTAFHRPDISVLAVLSMRTA